jgi:FMN phosphatase YigB (HAD superfamily)
VNHAVRCHSFDVFDTCLVRTLAMPQDLFHAMGQRLLAASGRSPLADEVHEFVRERVEAERRARRACAREDLTLDDIYAHYPEEAPFGLSPREIMAAELDMERQCMRPVPAMLDHIRSLRHRGADILYISDMFLPESFVSELLREHGFLEPGDRVYVSGTRGVTKHTGNLFRLVLDELGLAPGEMVHTGDNPHTDVAVPRALGILARREESACLTALERGMLSRDGRTCLTRSAMAGAARLARLAGGGDGTDTPLARVAADVAGPMVAGFVSWVLGRAREQGIERLWFVARDGQIMHAVARELLGDTPGPDCRYLYGSRQAWFLPSLTTFTPAEAEWLVIPGHCTRPASIVAKLDCTPGEIEDAARVRLGDAFWQTPLPCGETDRLIALLVAPAVRALVEAKAGAARERMGAYLRQEGMADGEPVVLVDVGWTLKAQRALSRVLTACGLDCPVSGMYLGVSQSALTASQAGPYQAYFLERDGWFDSAQPMNFFFRNANLVEQVFTAATHGQTVGYARGSDGRMEPVLRPDARGAMGLAAVEAMQARILAFARQAAVMGALSRPEIVFDVALGALWSFLVRPEPDLARAVCSLPVFDDQNERRRRPLARPVSPGLLARLVLGETPLVRLLSRPRYAESFDWIEGAIALSPAWMRRFLDRERMFLRLKAFRKSL